jgi:ankyrin repeat protein
MKIKNTVFFIFLACILFSAVLYNGYGQDDVDDEFIQAVRNNDVAAAKNLIDKVSNINAGMYMDLPPMAFAGSREMVELLLSKGAKINYAPDANKIVDYVNNISEGNYDLNWIKYLMQKGVKLTGTGGQKNTVLHFAARKGLKDLVVFFLNNKVNVNAKNGDGKTALHLVIECNESYKNKICRLLLSNGAKPNNRDSEGRTETMTSLNHGDFELLKMLVESGGDVKTRDNLKMSMLHIITQDIRKFEYLVSKGADINAQDKDKTTPLHQAVKGKHKPVVEFLLSKGAKTDIRASFPGGLGDLGGECYMVTPLMIAVIGDMPDYVKILLEKGANPNIPDAKKKTSLQYAEGRDEVRELLIKHGAK